MAGAAATARPLGPFMHDDPGKAPAIMTGSQPPNIGQLGVRQLAAGGWRHLCIVQRSAVQCRHGMDAAGIRTVRVA